MTLSGLSLANQYGSASPRKTPGCRKDPRSSLNNPRIDSVSMGTT
jgi:hypothetical protein